MLSGISTGQRSSETDLISNSVCMCHMRGAQECEKQSVFDGAVWMHIPKDKEKYNALGIENSYKMTMMLHAPNT